MISVDLDHLGVGGDSRVLRGARKDFADADAPWPEDEYEAFQRESLQRPLGLALPPSPRR